MARKKFVKTYNYTCTLTGEKFKTTSEANSPEELVSVNAWYEMNPEKDDRPEVVKLQIQNSIVEDTPDLDSEEESDNL